MAFKKYAKKVAKKVYRSVKKRYVRKGKPNVANIVKDVKWLKSVLNPEKKRFSITPAAQLTVGQVSANNSGGYSADVTPKPSQGTSYSTRNGSSIKLHSTDVKFQFWSQSATYSAIKGAIFWVQVIGEPYTDPSTAYGEFFAINPFSGVRDFNSDRQIDSMRNFKIIRRKNFYLKQNDITTTGHNMSVSFRLGALYKNYHCRFDLDTTTITAGQLLMFIVCDAGNISTSTSTLAHIPVQTASSGMKFMYDITHFYYDN